MVYRVNYPPHMAKIHGPTLITPCLTMIAAVCEPYPTHGVIKYIVNTFVVLHFAVSKYYFVNKLTRVSSTSDLFEIGNVT